MNKLVSVIITTYNTNDKLYRAINSVINQTYKNLEIIVVDDNGVGTEGQIIAEKIIKKFSHLNNIKYIKHEKNKNGAAARNTGIKASYGEYIAFLDDDDFFLPTRIEKCVCEILKKESDGVISSVGFINNNKIYKINTVAVKEVRQYDLLINNNLLGTGSNIFIDKKVLQKLNSFDEEFLRYQDIEFMIRFLESFKLTTFDYVTVIKDSTQSLMTKINYTKISNMTSLFLKRFETIINKYNNKNMILKTYYSILLYSAVRTKNKKNIDEAKTLLKSINSFSYIIYIKMKVSSRLTINKYFKSKNKKLKKSLEYSDYDYLSKIVN